jgi:hypothetical protein
MHKLDGRIESFRPGHFIGSADTLGQVSNALQSHWPGIDRQFGGMKGWAGGGGGAAQRSISTVAVAELGPWASFEVP